jgi:hypothetical protein
VPHRPRKVWYSAPAEWVDQGVEHDPNALRLGVIDIGELAHAEGKVSPSARLGDLHLAPRVVRVEKDG